MSFPTETHILTSGNKKKNSRERCLGNKKIPCREPSYRALLSQGRPCLKSNGLKVNGFHGPKGFSRSLILQTRLLNLVWVFFTALPRAVSLRVNTRCGWSWIPQGALRCSRCPSIRSVCNGRQDLTNVFAVLYFGIARLMIFKFTISTRQQIHPPLSYKSFLTCGGW